MKRLKGTLSTVEVAQRWAVKSSKVIQLIRSGQLEAFDVSLKPGGRPRFRITLEAMQKFEQQRAVQKSPKQPRRYRRPKAPGFVKYIT